MENYLSGLNENQLKAVKTQSRHVRVVAGAGSGKTRVLTTRIAYVIDQWGIPAENVLAITFTNKAANEMKTRVEKMLSGKTLGAHVSTIHSFCVSVLRQEIRREGYPSNFTILDVEDQKSIIREALKEFELSVKDYTLGKCLDFIANNKSAGFSPEASLEKAYAKYFENMSKIYGYYEKRCGELYGLDFDDLLLWTNRIFKKYPEVRKKWQNKYHFILVDEYQDIDNVQNELIQLLTNENTFLYVVGDPDQTIYSWRGADINIIMGFEAAYPDSETIVLDQNYRSTQTILNGANSVIQYNKNRVKKDLFTRNVEGNKIIHFTAGSDENEAAYVASRINRLVANHYNYRSIAILYRSAYLSKAMEKALINNSIEYKIFGGIRFFERAEIKDMLSYLRMLTVSDDLSFKRIINTPKRGIGEKSIEALFNHARLTTQSLFEAIDTFEESPKTKEKFLAFKKQVLDWQNRAKTLTLEQTFQMVLEESGYKKMLKDSPDEADTERLDNIKELLNDIIQFQEAHETLDMADYLAEIALYTDVEAKNNATDYVTLMTIHAAKGLEFDNVFVIGMSEGVFPSERTTSESGNKGLEEERRLAYVAFTRARKNLFLTDNNGFSYVATGNKMTSRFVSEIDEQYIESSGLDSRTIRSEAVSSYNLSSDNFPSSSVSHKPASKSKYKVGDAVVHDIFGEGVILSINENNIGDIAFGYPHMTKKIALDFPKLHKKEG